MRSRLLALGAIVLCCLASSSVGATSAAPPTISIAPSSLTGAVGTPIASISPSLSSDVVSVSISPALVAQTGLGFDTTTGTISGTPTSPHSAIYKLTAVNAANKTASATIQITIDDLPPAIAYPVNNYAFLVGAQIASIVPTLTNVSTVSIFPDVTAYGLSFNGRTGKISGTPNSAIAQGYLLTATNSTGQTATTSINISLNSVVPPAAPEPSSAPGCEYTLSIADFQSTNSAVTSPQVYAGATQVFAGGDGLFHIPLTDASYNPIVDTNSPIPPAVPDGVWEVTRSAGSFVAGNSGHQDDSGLSGYVSYTVAATVNCPIVDVTNYKGGGNGYEDEQNDMSKIGKAGDDQYCWSGNSTFADTIFAESTTTTAADLYIVSYTAAALCTLCGGGSTCTAVPGNVSCGCETGSYGAANLGAPPSCTTCPAGDYCPPGSTAPVPCAAGYGSDPGASACTPVDACATNNGGCGGPAYYTCTNNIGAAPTCTPIDLCAINNGGCGDSTYYTCSNNIGAAPTCAPIDLCAVNNGGCGDSTYYSCTNNIGAAPTCAPIDLCAVNNGGCGDSTYYSCSNNIGAAPTCAPIDLCAVNNGGCGNPVYSTCANNIGAPPTCTSPNLCAINNGGCGDSDVFSCTENPGGPPICSVFGQICPSAQAQCGSAITSTLSDPNNCGSCGNVCPAGAGSPTCNNGRCLITLATGQITPGFVTSDGTNVYWQQNATGGNSAIRHVPNGGGAVVDDAFGLGPVHGLAVDPATHKIYWAEQTPTPGVFTGSVKVVRPGGANLQTLANLGATPRFPLLDSTNLYFALYNPNENIGQEVVMPLAGGQAAVFLGLTGVPSIAPWAASIDANNFYYENAASSVQALELFSRSRTTGQVGTFPVTSCQIGGCHIPIDSTYIYYTSSECFGTLAQCQGSRTSAVFRSKKDGSSIAQQISSSQEGWTQDVAIDSTYVYWANAGAGTIVRARLDGAPFLPGGGTEEILATNQYLPLYLTVDPTGVYWETGTPDSVTADGTVVQLTPKSTCAPDPCETNNGGCPAITTCDATSGAISCGACPAGYQRDGSSCVDINECLIGNGGCAEACINTPGSFHCSCPPGFAAPNGGGNCVDVNECASNNGGCSPLVGCANIVGSFLCGPCPQGYAGNGFGADGCTDVNECAGNNGGCSSVAICLNKPGSFQCQCSSGYMGDGIGADGCIDVNECQSNNGGCDSDCVNVPGSFFCGSSCPNGYNAGGSSDIDVNECALDNGGCGSAPCFDSPGAWVCGCNPG